ncbi:hypothetical protein H7Q97_02745 [Ochrobactrum sp. CM-21-5]|nr:hypothetical protein [Ochrobactrum sp. CM-21-5]MBC2884318.1 hypothetical protein [Ochrobactrum sp. CM-21-5]
MSDVIPLTEQIKAIHPMTGKPCTVVGVDTSYAMPRLIIINRGPGGVSAEVVDSVENEEPRSAA